MVAAESIGELDLYFTSDLLCAAWDMAGVSDWTITAINSLRWLIPRIVVLGWRRADWLLG